MSQREGNVLGAYCVFIKNLHADTWKEVGVKATTFVECLLYT